MHIRERINKAKKIIAVFKEITRKESPDFFPIIIVACMYYIAYIDKYIEKPFVKYLQSFLILLLQVNVRVLQHVLLHLKDKVISVCLWK